MKRAHPSVSASTRALIGLCFALVLSGVLIPGCSPRPTSGQSSPESNSPSAFTPGGGEPQAARDARGVGYFMTKDDKVVPVRLDAVGTDKGAVLRALFAGAPADATGAGYSTAIPKGTTLRSVSIEASTAVVDVSRAFESGGGSLSAQARVAQVVFTLTRDPGVVAVLFKMEGKPIASLGGEGVSLSKPQTRADWEDFSPLVLIESPVLNDVVAGDFPVRGTAAVLEGKFTLELHYQGATRTAHRLKSSSGTITRGSFESTETATTIPRGAAELVAIYIEPSDSSRVVSMKVPLTIR